MLIMAVSGSKIEIPTCHCILYSWLKFAYIVIGFQNSDTCVFSFNYKFNSRIEKLKREAELLEYKMEQQNKFIDFEKENRSVSYIKNI